MTENVTLHEYHARFSSESTNEYWFGKVIRRSSPTWLHSITQLLIAESLTRAGYTAGSGLELRIDQNWESKPDLAAALKIEQPYPTRPVDIVAEVLSPGDAIHAVHEKCKQYARIGIGQIFCLDPESKKALEWDRSRANLERITVLACITAAAFALTKMCG